MRKHIRFDIYRYQIVPRDRFFQGELFGGIQSIDDLLQKKNEILRQHILQLADFQTPRTQVRGKLLYDDDDFLLYRLAANRALTRETEDFKEEELDNWPSFLVGVWNDPSKQLVAIQERREAFQNTDSVLRAIVSTLNRVLNRRQLRILAEPLFHEREFWKIVKRYERKIMDIKFELITPNMANISHTLSQDLKNLAINTNTTKTELAIKSDPDSALRIDRGDNQIAGLVKYASQGGGNISLKASGIKRRVQTARTRKSLDISEIEITGKSGEEIVHLMKQLLP